MNATESVLERIEREGPACSKCRGRTTIIGELELAGVTYDYYACQLCRTVGDTRPRLK